MQKKLIYLGLFVIVFLFIQCKKEPISTQYSVQHLSDFETNDGAIHLTVKGGKPPYQINWSIPGNDTVLLNLSAGIYYLTITDAKLSSFSDTIIINQPPWPVCIDNENNSYKTGVFGNQIWMLQNLRTTNTNQGAPIESFVFNDSSNYVETYGRLYTWSQAMNNEISEGAQGICPDGWRIPSDDDWELLIDNISTADKEIPNLVKELSLTFPGFYNNGFQNMETSVSFWSSTNAGDNAWKRYFNKNLSKAYRYHENKNIGISVRCIKNREPEI